MKVTSLFYAPFRLCKSLTTACFLIFACHATLMPAQSLNWRQIPGSAIDVGVGANGAVWVIGTGEPTPDQGIYRWTGSGFNKVAGGGVRIAVDPMGNPWVINSAGEIYRSENSGTKFIALPGKASDIGIGANGTVWIVGTNTVPGGYGVYRWNGSAFVAMPGGGVRISVDPDGYAWVVNSVGRIYRFVGSGFVTMPGEAVDIGIGGDGSVFISGTNGNVYKWNGVSDWVKLDGGGLIAVAADGTGNPWAVNSGRSIYAGTNVNVAPLGIQARKEIFEANRRDPANIGRFGIMQNTHPTNYVWYTIYTYQLIGRSQVTSGCLPPNSYTFKAWPFDSGKMAFKILYELKEGPTCYGGNLCATDSTRVIDGVAVYPKMVGNAGSCFIEWEAHPNPNYAFEHPLYSATYHANR